MTVSSLSILPHSTKLARGRKSRLRVHLTLRPCKSGQLRSLTDSLLLSAQFPSVLPDDILKDPSRVSPAVPQQVIPQSNIDDIVFSKRPQVFFSLYIETLDSVKDIGLDYPVTTFNAVYGCSCRIF